MFFRSKMFDHKICSFFAFFFCFFPPCINKNKAAMERSISSAMVKISEDTIKVPSILSFPQGVPNKPMDLTVGKKKKKRMIISDMDGVSFKGYDFGDYSRDNDSCSYVIGVLDENSQEIRLITKEEHAFVMKSELYSHRSVVASKSLSNLTSMERKQSLTEEFGSRKKKRALQAAQSNVISSENISGATTVESVMSSEYKGTTADDDQTALSSLDASAQALEFNRIELLPTFDEHATITANIYPIDSLIPPKIQTSLSEFFTEIASKETSPMDLFKVAEKFLRSEQGMVICQDLITVGGGSLGGSSASEKTKAKKYIEKVLFLHFILQFYSKMVLNGDKSVSKEDVNACLKAPQPIMSFISGKFAGIIIFF